MCLRFNTPSWTGYHKTILKTHLIIVECVDETGNAPRLFTEGVVGAEYPKEVKTEFDKHSQQTQILLVLLPRD